MNINYISKCNSINNKIKYNSRNINNKVNLII